MKSLTGPTTYANKKQLNTNKISLRKSHTCLAISAILCFACLLTSQCNTNCRKLRANHPTHADEISTATPTDTTEHKAGTTGLTKQVRTMLGYENPETILELTQNDRNLNMNSHTVTRNPTKVREATPPSRNHAQAETNHRDARAAGRICRDNAESGRILDPAQMQRAPQNATEVKHAKWRHITTNTPPSTARRWARRNRI